MRARLLLAVTAAGLATQVAENAWRLQLRRRNKLISEAAAAGASQRTTAAAAGLSRSRVVAVIDKSVADFPGEESVADL